MTLTGAPLPHPLISWPLSLAGSDWGRVRIDFDDALSLPFKPDDHHMGTTRMHNDPKLGVVDENCKVHGTDNLFIAGSSVFPSSGFANPTLTLVSLALRLADHIKGAYS